MGALSSLQQSIQSGLTTYAPSLKKFSPLVLSVGSFASSYLFYQRYKNTTANERKNPLLLSYAHKSADSFLPLEIPKKNVMSEIVEQVQEDMKSVFVEALRYAFNGKFELSRRCLQIQEGEEVSAEVQEMNRQKEQKTRIINQLEVVATYGTLTAPLRTDATIEDYMMAAKLSWKNAFAQSPNEDNIEHFFSLIEAGLSRGWFEEESEGLDLERFLPENATLPKKIWMTHLVLRVKEMLKQSSVILREEFESSLQELQNLTPDSDVVPEDLLKLVPYFSGLANSEEYLQKVVPAIFKVLKLDTQSALNIFPRILNYFSSKQTQARRWVLSQIKEAINSVEDSRTKIQLLTILQSDFIRLGENEEARQVIEHANTLIRAHPLEKKAPILRFASISCVALGALSLLYGLTAGFFKKD